MKSDAEQALEILRDPGDARGSEWVFSAASRLLAQQGVASDAIDPGAEHLVRRALLELARRKVARLDDDFSRPFFDDLFNPAAASPVTFGELANQYLHQEIEATGLRRHQEPKVKRVVDITPLGRASPLAARAGCVTASLAMGPSPCFVDRSNASMIEAAVDARSGAYTVDRLGKERTIPILNFRRSATSPRLTGCPTNATRGIRPCRPWFAVLTDRRWQRRVSGRPSRLALSAGSTRW